MEWLARFFFQKYITHMLSQNLFSVLGFPGCVSCRNQRWMLRTSQSSCLRGPPISFHQGCYETRYQENIFIFTINRSALVYTGDNCFPCIFYPLLSWLYWILRTRPSTSSMNKDNHLGQEKPLIMKQHWKYKSHSSACISSATKT